MYTYSVPILVLKKSTTNVFTYQLPLQVEVVEGEQDQRHPQHHVDQAALEARELLPTLERGKLRMRMIGAEYSVLPYKGPLSYSRGDG